MARMIPAVPREVNEYSREDEMFKALESLPDDYTVVHSFTVLTIENKKICESESDFVVIHPEKGILFIEAKASVNGYKLQQGEWYYKSGKKMAHGGPMRQALRAMHNFEDKVRDAGQEKLLQDVRLECCIWLLSIDRAKLDTLRLPPEIDAHLILTEESLLNIEADIDRIFTYQRHQQPKTRMSGKTVNALLEKYICPEFELVPSTGVALIEKRLAFNRLLQEQSRLLDYLVDQPVGVINGAAGTGKTMLAVEMAQRYARQGERTLFLCYNKGLCEHLQESRQHDLVDYYTIDGYAVKMTPSNTINYSELHDVLLEHEDLFPYVHVIIDEGQDFGKELIEENGLFDLFELLATDEKRKGTFFVFYDSNQLIQASEMPAYIESADCRLTLYRNSRNTHCIAQTSTKPLPDTRRIKLSDKCLVGEPPIFMFAETAEETKKSVDQIIRRLLEKGISNIQLLTMKTEEKSILAPYTADDGKYHFEMAKIPFTSCRKFKGLEADAIILVDVDQDVFENEEIKRIFYVGTSRARLSLNIISILNAESCSQVITEWEIPRTSKNPMKTISGYFRCNYKKLEDEGER